MSSKSLAITSLTAVETEDRKPLISFLLPTAQTLAPNIRSAVQPAEGRFGTQPAYPFVRHGRTERPSGAPGVPGQETLSGSVGTYPVDGKKYRPATGSASLRFKVLALAISALTSLLAATVMRSSMFLS